MITCPMIFRRSQQNISSANLAECSAAARDVTPACFETPIDASLSIASTVQVPAKPLNESVDLREMKISCSLYVLLE